MKKLFSYLCLLFILVPAISSAHEIRVVVNKNNPLKSLTKQQVTDLYMGRSQYFPTGTIVVKIDAPNRSGLRAAFYENLVRMSVAEVNAYWARLLFSGRAAPPMSVSDDSEVLALVETNPNAIGYIFADSAEKSQVKTVAVIDIP
jgi:ABC-type phosphate transport system substrate-binding protein